MATEIYSREKCCLDRALTVANLFRAAAVAKFDFFFFVQNISGFFHIFFARFDEAVIAAVSCIIKRFVRFCNLCPLMDAKPE